MLTLRDVVLFDFDTLRLQRSGLNLSRSRLLLLRLDPQRLCLLLFLILNLHLLLGRTSFWQ